MQLSRWFVLKMSPRIRTCIHPQKPWTPLHNSIKFRFYTGKELLAWNTKDSKSICNLFLIIAVFSEELFSTTGNV